jgi:hypothetical protein
MQLPGTLWSKNKTNNYHPEYESLPLQKDKNTSATRSVSTPLAES